MKQNNQIYNSIGRVEKLSKEKKQGSEKAVFESQHLNQNNKICRD